jgi:hypothetical protein
LNVCGYIKNKDRNSLIKERKETKEREKEKAIYGKYIPFSPCGP